MLTGLLRELGLLSWNEEEVGIQIPGKPSDPKNFMSYLGQDKIKRRLELRLNSLNKNDPHNNHLRMLLSASAGLGKTAFARTVAYEMANRGLIDHYHEVVAGKIDTKPQLDKFIAFIKPHSFIFIDEIHGLQGSARDALLPALQDEVYAFDATGSTMVGLPEGLTWVGATTDVGQVHAALQRRLSVITLEPMSFDNRVVLALTLNMTEQAAVLTADRCWTPWEIKDEVYIVSRDIAFENKSPFILVEHVAEAMDILGIDEHGLREPERVLLRTLYNNPQTRAHMKRYGMSVRSLVAAAGIDMPTYIDKFEPKLLALGLVRISPGIGRELTEKAQEWYFQ